MRVFVYHEFGDFSRYDLNSKSSISALFIIWANEGANAGMKALRGLGVSFVYRAKSREREDNKNAA